MATYVIYGDAADAWIYGGNGVYLTARSTYLGAGPNQTYLEVGQGNYTGWYECYQSFISFDTSTVSGTPSSATLSLYGWGDVTTTSDFTIYARAMDWGTSVEAADWTAGASLSALPLRASFNTSGFAVEAYNDFTADASFKSNLSNPVRLVLSGDRMEAGTEPTGEEHVQVYPADTTGTTKDPKLTILVTEDYPSVVLADTPALYWKLDEASGAPADSSGNSRAGTWSAGPAAYQAGALRIGGQSADLERDSSHRATIADAAWMQNVRTVEAWITVESLPTSGNWHTICDKGDLWDTALYYDGATRTIEVSSHTGAGAYGIWKWTWTPDLNKPYHVAWAWTVNAGTWVIGDMDFYLNGRLYTTGKAYATSGGTPSGAFIDNGTAWTVGAFNDGSGAWDGKMGDFALYGSVLSGDRLAAHYDIGYIWEPGSDSTFMLNTVSRAGARLT